MLFSDGMWDVSPLYTVRKWQIFLSFWCFARGDRTLSLLWQSGSLWPAPQPSPWPYTSHGPSQITWETQEKLLPTCKGTSRWELKPQTITFTPWWINSTLRHRRWSQAASLWQGAAIPAVRHPARLWASSSSRVTEMTPRLPQQRKRKTLAFT